MYVTMADRMSHMTPEAETDYRSSPSAERTNAFVTLVFGYSVVALLYQNRAEMGVNA